MIYGVCQAASGVTSSYDALLDLFDCLGNFLKRLEIYTTIPPTPIITDIIIKIMVELLSVLALATKQIKQGRFSKCAATYALPVIQCATREVHEKVDGGERDRSCSPEIGSIDPGGGADDCCGDLGRGSWSCGQYESSYGRCVIVAGLIADIFLTTCSVRWQGINGLYSTGFGSVSHVKRLLPVLTWVYSRSSPSVKRNE